jgi:ABC-type bacteriocin/lantibiotic exporter with double-glycine peptidase domain
MAENKSTNALGRLFKLLNSEKRDIKNILLFAIVSGLINLSLPLGIQAVINFLNAGQLSTSWAVLVIFVLLGISLVGFLQVRQLTITENIERKIFARAAFDFAFRLPRIKQKAVQNKYLPELVNRFFEIVTVQKGLSKLLVDFSSASIQIVFGLFLLSLYHPLFLLLGIGLMGILFLIFRITGKPGLTTSLEESKYKFEVAHWLEEIGRTMSTFKFLGNSELPIQRTDGLVDNYLTARKKHFRILVWQFGGMIAFKVLVAAGLLILGSMLVIDKQINIGQFVASEIIIVLIIGAVEKLILSMQTIYDLLTALEKIGTVTDLPLENNTGTDLRDTPCDSGVEIRFNNVTFTYPDGTEPVISNFQAAVKPGERLFIKGKNGSGKTSLLKLMTGLYEEFNGTITINGFPINSLKIEALRAITGDNFNECDVFKGTLYENIHAGRGSITSDDVLWAMKQVELLQFLEHSPDGLQTQIDPEGRRLSSGIIHKIVLARSIAERPKILLLEDSLTNLDQTERTSIYSNILNKSNGWTVIMTSNDPLIASECDSTIELENGCIQN